MIIIHDKYFQKTQYAKASYAASSKCSKISDLFDYIMFHTPYIILIKT